MDIIKYFFKTVTTAICIYLWKELEYLKLYVGLFVSYEEVSLGLLQRYPIVCILNRREENVCVEKLCMY